MKTFAPSRYGKQVSLRSFQFGPSRAEVSVAFAASAIGCDRDQRISTRPSAAPAPSPPKRVVSARQRRGRGVVPEIPAAPGCAFAGVVPGGSPPAAVGPVRIVPVAAPPRLAWIAQATA